ncbi:pseudouridine-5'-phosphate glycosidase [Nocardia mexicana]|uniref:Pseudouridine-5'-phosphate glycosidase n=1 Tax=Nocardia mexicana TaxID=279262 RepID=A0A370H9R5_9NOCA|nr:pseudouridine-5'-phosphate glycosidase [Nocardia mexicana]RDI53408.1 pseudouridine-5'-phosphate glycosidase [Nocardia mexicana]
MSDVVAPVASLFRLSDEVRDALARGRPVVALESNVVAHGFRRPDNVAVAGEVERAVRAGGAVPATIALVDGRIVVGTDDRDIERLGTATDVAKVTTRDIAVALARGGLGATSIAATMAIADRVGIATVASAGLGGVHRGAETTMDISADLTELARTRLIVVCAGVKKILDAGLTLEFLETQGTPVIGYKHREFPAFYCRDSGFSTQTRIDDPREIAEIARLHRQLPGAGSLLITHPIPAADALDGEAIEAAIQQALARADTEHITGPAVTTFVLRAVDAATGGAAAAANRAVLISTAEAAAEIETARAALEQGARSGDRAVPSSDTARRDPIRTAPQGGLTHVER